MATVRLSFSPSPAHVRTARLVGVAVARRAGVADATLDEVRLAIGEACSRAVALHSRHALTDLIEVEIQDETRFTVRVTDRAPIPVTLGVAPAAGPSPVALLGAPSGTAVLPGPESSNIDAADIDAINEEDVAVGMGLTLLAGLVDDVSVRPATVGVGTEVRMSWPTGPHQ
jgi:anti-sigma regulatory factor (Ser/Thr protein kinase)